MSKPDFMPLPERKLPKALSGTGCMHSQGPASSLGEDGLPHSIYCLLKLANLWLSTVIKPTLIVKLGLKIKGNTCKWMPISWSYPNLKRQSKQTLVHST